MKIAVSDLKQNRQWRAMLGISEKQFYILLKPFKKVYFDTHKEELSKRKVDVNINYCIKNEEELLLFTLLSLKVGLTYDALGIFCGMNASNAKRNQKIGLGILKETLKQLDHMPVRNILNNKGFNEFFKDETDLIIDVTEQRIQRPCDNETQKEHYSGKKSPYIKNDCHNNNIKSYKISELCLHR